MVEEILARCRCSLDPTENVCVRVGGMVILQDGIEHKVAEKGIPPNKKTTNRAQMVVWKHENGPPFSCAILPLGRLPATVEDPCGVSVSV